MLGDFQPFLSRDRHIVKIFHLYDTQCRNYELFYPQYFPYPGHMPIKCNLFSTHNEHFEIALTFAFVNFDIGFEVVQII